MIKSIINFFPKSVYSRQNSQPKPNRDTPSPRSLTPVSNINEKAAENLLLKLRQKTIGIPEALKALEELKALPTELRSAVLKEAQRSFQALPDDQQEDLLTKQSIRDLDNLPSHRIFANRKTTNWQTYRRDVPF